jgi:hypothetical protein
MKSVLLIVIVWVFPKIVFANEEHIAICHPWVNQIGPSYPKSNSAFDDRNDWGFDGTEWFKVGPPEHNPREVKGLTLLTETDLDAGRSLRDKPPITLKFIDNATNTIETFDNPRKAVKHYKAWYSYSRIGEASHQSTLTSVEVDFDGGAPFIFYKFERSGPGGSGSSIAVYRTGCFKIRQP